MTNGSCIIDGVDLYDIGCFIAKGGDHDLLSFPERKEPTQVNWFERDGIDVDLSEIFFNDKKVSVKFYSYANSPEDFLFNLDSFYSLLMQPGYRTLVSRELDKTFTLRYLGCSDYEHHHGISFLGKKSAFVTIDFNMDNPLQIFSGSLVPDINRSIQTHVKINGHDFSKFGITVRNVYATAFRAPNVKEGIVRSFERSNGIMADTAFTPRAKSKDIVIECTMMAPNRDSFYSNYSALFNQSTLLEPVTLTFTVGSTLVYYSRMDSFTKIKSFSSGVHVTFNLVYKTIDAGNTISA